jgi:hypothetical protein
MVEKPAGAAGSLQGDQLCGGQKGENMTMAGAANPTLTIVALALRQAEHIGREAAAGRV